MSQEADRDSKSEEPSEKKIADAHTEGNTAFSREMLNLGSLIGIFIALYAIINGTNIGVISSLRYMISSVAEVALNSPGNLFQFSQVALKPGAFLICFFSVLVIAFTMICSCAQSAPAPVMKRIAPKLERISPAKAIKRLLGSNGIFEFGKNLIKIVLIFTVCWAFLMPKATTLGSILQSASDTIPSTIFWYYIAIMSVIVFLYLPIAATDFMWTRWSWKKQLKMTRQEVKDELKNSDGNPLFRAYRRSKSFEISRQRTLSAVSRSTLLITNPTHFAIALRYVAGESAAPVVLAKGQDKLALRIRSIAETHNIPAHENKALARSLYKAVNVDQAIPTEFYRAVAEVIVMVSKTRAQHVIH